MKCSLCGFEFEEERIACQGCILAKGCNMVCCPNCGYKIPLKSKIVKFLQKRRK